MDLKIGGVGAYWLLKKLLGKPAARETHSAGASDVVTGARKLERFFGPQFSTLLYGTTVLDHGCGRGREAVALALKGAKFVYGTDIREDCLQGARQLAAQSGVASKCNFLNATTQHAAIEKEVTNLDFAYSIDSFEHYGDPAQVLAQVYQCLRPGGRFFISFGPPWKHPRGCHMMFLRPVPWMHLIFKEETIMAVRSLYRTDGARRFEEVEGGLNRMTVRWFLELVEQSGFLVARIRLIPIKSMNWVVESVFLREYFTSIVQCLLAKPADMNR